MNKPQEAVKQVGFRGYSTHREFGGNRIPVPIQNLMMRDYTSRRNLMFKLGIDEFNFPNCYLRLMSLLEELPTLEGIVMCSLFMLPKEQGVRLSIYEAFFDHGAALHLIMENAIVQHPDDVAYVEELFQLSETLKVCPTSIPNELLPPLNISTFFTSEEEK